MTDTPNDWTDNDLEKLSRIAPSAGRAEGVSPALEEAMSHEPRIRLSHIEGVGIVP